MTNRTRRGGSPARLLAALGLLFAGLAAASCVGEGQLETYACPRPEVFKASVSPFLERRCGTLDCHGQMTRPMRIYSEFGLRHPQENNVTGGVPTTQLELDANFAAVCNLQPQKMQEVVDDNGITAETLLLVNKARGLERHKGGKVVEEQDPGDRCILGWLTISDAAEVANICAAAIAPLE